MSHLTRNKRQKDSKIPTKIVVRRLPPNFTSTTFKEQVAPIPECNYFHFVNADKPDKTNSFSRVYINFVHPEDVYTFKKKIDNYVFLGPKGQEYPAVVEFAPFQKIPRDCFFQKRDQKCGTIQSNEYYLQFVKNLQLSKSKSIIRPEYDLQLNTQLTQLDHLTPLVKYVTARKSERAKECMEKMKELKQQKHDAYTMVFVNSSVKKNINRRAYLKRYSQ